MKQRLISLIMVFLGIAAGAQAGNLYVGGTQLTVGQSYNSLNGPSCLWAGTITFTDATHVTLENVTLNLNASGGVANRTAISSDINYLVITLVGENKIQGDGVKTGLYLSYTTSIIGDGSLDIVAVENGIEAVASAGLTITDAHVKAKGGTNGIKGNQSILNIYGNGIFEAYGGTKCVASIKRLGGGTAVTAPAGATFNSSVLSVVDEYNNPIKNQWVTIQKAVIVNETNFPDEKFRKRILAQDYGSDGYLTDAEIADVKYLSVGNNNIASLKGIEFFTALENLFCGGNQLKSLDVSKNTALTSLSCGGNQLKSLDVSKNTALTSLSCGGNQLTSLDVSKNTALTKLDCSNNQLTALDVSENTALTKLDCSNNQLTALDVSENTKLTELDCYSNQLTSLDVSKNTVIDNLSCSNNQLTSLDVSKNKKLSILSCSKNQLTSLDVSTNTALLGLICNENQLTSLDVSHNTALQVICCYGNNIRGESMTMLVKSLRSFGEVEVGSRLFWPYQNITPIDNYITAAQVKIAKDNGWNVVMKNKSDDWINYEGEPVVPIDEMNFPDANFRNWALSQPYGADGYLDDEEIAAVNAIDVSNKNIANLKGIEHFTAVTYLDCSNNQLDGFDVSQNTNLKQLFCSYNMLGGLDVSKNTALSSLGCDHNQLTALDVSQNTALTILECFNNQLTALDVSQNTALTDLYCYDNRLPTLDVSKNKKLRAVTCYHNVIRGEGMDALVNSLPEETEGQLVVYKDETIAGNVITALQVAVAKGRKWKVMRISDIGVPEEYEGSPVVAVNGENFPDEKFRNWVLAQDYGKDGYLTDAEIAAVTEIDVSNKGITSLKGIEHFTALTKLKCSRNSSLVELDVSKLTALTELACSYTSLTALDISNNTALKVLHCNGNELTVLDVSNLTLLNELVCGDNKLTILDVSKNTALTDLECDGNKLTALDTSNNTALTVLYCFNNQLTVLNVSNLTLLNELNCNQNQLTTLDVSKNTVLKQLRCADNKLTTLDLLKNTLLWWLECYGNAIRGKGMTALVNSLPTISGRMDVYFFEPPTGNEMTVLDVKIAKDKGWSVNKANDYDWEEYEGVKVEAQLAFSVSTADATYGADFTAPTLTNPNGLTVTYTSSNGEVATINATTGAVAIAGAGTTIISAAFAGNGTYEAVTVSYTLTVAKAVPTVTAPVAIAKLVANGTAQALITAGTTTGGEMQYSLDGSAWSTTIPTGTDAGTYTVHYKVVGNKNYKDVDEKKLTVTMVKSTDTGLAFSAATADATYGGSFTALILTNPKSLAVTYKSSKTDVATVHATTGAVTIVGVGTTVISAEFAGNSTYEAATVSYTLTVAKAVPTVTAPVAIANLTANGTAQPLVTAGITTGGEMQYSLDGSTWSTAIPTATDAGSYTVHYKVVGNKNYKDVAAKTLTVTMAKATATGLAFSVATATATYGAAFTAPTLTNPNRLAVTYKSSNGEVATVDGSTGAVAIVGAGTAIISAEFAGNGTYEAATVSYTLTVAKAVPIVTAPVAIAKLVANGSAQALVTAGTTTAGEMQYSLDGSTWSTAIPTATDAGTYTVHYKVVGNKNYEDVAEKTFTVTMAKSTATGLAFSAATASATYGADFTAPTLTNPKSLAVTYKSSKTDVATVNSTTGIVAIAGAGTAEISAEFAGNGTYEAATVSYTLTVAKAVPTVTAPVAVANLTANGTALPLVTAGTTTGGEMQYSLDGSAWSTAIPTATDAGTYTIYYKVVGNKNYEDVAAKTLTVKMAKATATGLTFSSATAEATYGAAFTAPTLSNPKSLAVTYNSSDTEVAAVDATTGAVTIVGAGTAVINAVFAGNGTYEAVTVSYTLTVAKAVPTVTAPVAVANLIATGEALALVSAGTTSAGEMQYSLDGSVWSTAIPTAVDAGPYTVYYKVVGNKNYEDVAAKTLTVTMAKSTATGLAYSASTADVTYGAVFTAPTLSNPNTLRVTYSSSNADVATVNSTTGVVTIAGAGTAVISAAFAGNNIYEATTVSYTLTVVKAVPVVTAPVAVANLIANGTEQPLVTAGSTTGGEMQYSRDGSTWSTAIPTATEAGTYTVYYKVVGDRNYEDVATTSLKVTVARASATGLTFSSPTAEAVYGGSFTAPTLNNPKSLAVTYNSNDTEVATVDAETGAVTIVGAGTAVINAVFAGNGTYEAVTVSYTLTVAKAVPTVTAPVAIDDLTADGSALALITAGTTTGGEMQYSLDGTAWSTDIPTATEAGTYTVYYQVVGGRNYEDVAAQSVSVTVAASSVVDDDVEVGDANGDGTINAADIVEVVNYIMGHPSEKFKAKGADANEDGTVNAADIVKIVNMIMAKSRMRMGAFGWEDTGVEDVFEESAEPAIFDLQGHRLDSLRKGVNIIRDEHGRTKKIFVK